MTARSDKSTWLAPVVPVLLGAAVLAAEATSGDLAEGLVWFALLAGVGALLAFGGRFESVRLARGDGEDERERSINQRAMAAVGVVLMVALTAVIVFQVARGDDPSPYTQITALGGASYVAALLVLHRRS
jgi:ABC-type transport system involved in cytochrome c biogenesis permease component